jgi:hypothetical protein
MYGYLTCNPDQLVLLDPILPGCPEWQDNGHRFCASWYNDLNREVRFVTASEVKRILSFEDILSEKIL